MRGYYEVLRNTPQHVPGPSLRQTLALGAGPAGAWTGGPWALPQRPDGFNRVEMNHFAAGSVIGIMGVDTVGLAGCMVIAALQYDTQGRWERYYFAHLDASEWKYNAFTRSQAFRAAITAPARAYLLIANQGWSGIDDIVPAVQQWAVPAIPDYRTTAYAYTRGTETFAMRLTDGTVGECDLAWYG